jgi:hypothetical protein
MRFLPGWGEYRPLDAHGAGSQRSGPEAGDPADFPRGRGPQGDVIRILNFFRLVRGRGAKQPFSFQPSVRNFQSAARHPPRWGPFSDHNKIF